MTHIHSHKRERGGQIARTTIPECSSSYLPSDMDTEAGVGQQYLVHSHSVSDSMSDVDPRCTRGSDPQQMGKFIFDSAKAAYRKMSFASKTHQDNLDGSRHWLLSTHCSIVNKLVKSHVLLLLTKFSQGIEVS